MQVMSVIIMSDNVFNCLRSLNLHYINISPGHSTLILQVQQHKVFELSNMARLLPMFISVLLASTQADIKIVSTPDGKMGSEPCVRTCSGVDKDYSGWYNAGSYYPGKVHKYIDMSGCDFVSQPVVTAVSGNGYLCPSFIVTYVRSDYFTLFSVSDFTKDKMWQHQCRVYWTATGFTC